ncbi:MAG TPA: hypothetical protein VGP76_12830 [Planctomycetaceae bacterium]|jgi:hypothetical protein|nr:hypothetical protein [Planctomycetaceae bacterium]
MNRPALAFREIYPSMSSLPKRVLYASMGLAGVVAAACVLDLVGGWTFAHHWGMDVMLLIGAGIVIYLAIDALAEQK